MYDLTFIEMFSGIGGFRLGLKKSGWQCVWANDKDKYANRVYKTRFGTEELVEADINQVRTDTIPEATLLTAGFPCQAFSITGKRKGFQDSRGTLFYHIARVARAKRPPLLLLENVRGLLSTKAVTKAGTKIEGTAGYIFAKILQILDELGYNVEWQVLNSKYFGVPQNRERVFIIGHLRGTNSRQVFPIWAKLKTPTQMERFKQDCASTLTANYDSKFNDTYIQTDQGIRCLTPVEYERLQGFQDDWTKGLTDKQRYTVLGNAVTIDVIEFLGHKLKESIKDA